MNNYNSILQKLMQRSITTILITLVITTNFMLITSCSDSDDALILETSEQLSMELTIQPQLTYVPDDTFELKLINLGYDDTLDDYVLTASIDTITSLDLEYSKCTTDRPKIDDLTGIEDFTSLTALNCNGNQLTDLDLKHNTKLVKLSCENNIINSIDLTNNKSLTFLNCIDNKLSDLDVSNNADLQQLHCSNNQLTSLNVAQNSSLTYLVCYNNQIGDLVLSQHSSLRFLHCDDNQLSYLDLSDQTQLTDFFSRNNLFTNLDVSANNSLNIFRCEDSPNLTCIKVSQSQLSNIPSQWRISSSAAYAIDCN